MEDLIEQLLDGDIWVVVGAIIVTVAGSSAAAAGINSFAEGRRAAKGFRREVRDRALTAVGDAYTTYLRLGGIVGGPTATASEEADGALFKATSTVHSRVAAVGDAATYSLVSDFVATGELYAGHNEDTSVSDLDGKFDSLIRKLNEGIPR
ncbi:MAG: hypothetical protein P0Y60_01665 [Candidatus Microbacterium colombiense]|nr:MAG: hypothetical protein P0Y60_01665 [Microbacterium sp.]